MSSEASSLKRLVRAFGELRNGRSANTVVAEAALSPPTEELYAQTEYFCQPSILPRIVEGVSDDCRLTVVVPVRAGLGRPDLIRRLSFLREDRRIPPDVAFLVVDDGSPAELGHELRTVCGRDGYGYARLDTEPQVMSIGRARNVGAMLARSEYVMFQDVDLLPYDGFYESLLKEVQVQGLAENTESFLMVGVIYLTENGTERFLDTERDLRRETFIQALLDHDEETVEKFSTGTSVILLNREYYLSRGGNDEGFEGWGMEDIEFSARLLRRVRKFPLPQEFSLNYRTCASVVEYKGFKAVQRLFGDMTFQKGIILFHAWHPVDETSPYHREGRTKNRELLTRKILAHARTGIEPEPLPSLREGSTLMFSKNPFVFNRATMSRLGRVVVADERRFSPASILDYVEREQINRVLFFNPFATDHRLSLYRAVRKAGVSFVVAERGALRDSVFFDSTGFNCESDSYHPRYWDRPLSKERRKRLEEYIREELQSPDCLEQQGPRVGAGRLRQQLGIPANRKVLFVPLQRPSDSVIRHFCGPVGTFERFIDLVTEVVERLGEEWTVVVKKHPLEDVSPTIPGALFANGAHVKDLLDLSDSVLVINSGVGLLSSLIWRKPTFYAGSTFYAHDDLNRLVRSAEELAHLLDADFRPDGERAARFLSYLIEDYYSFGTMTTREVPWNEAGRMTATTNIEFYRVRGLGQTPFHARKDKAPLVNHSSILFDRYRQALRHTKSVPQSEEKNLKREKASKGPSKALKGPSKALKGPSKASKAPSKTPRRPSKAKRPLSNAGSPPGTAWMRKLKKLRESPDRFLLESRWRVLRAAALVFAKPSAVRRVSSGPEP